MSKCYTVYRWNKKGIQKQWLNVFNTYESALDYMLKYEGDRMDGLFIQIDWSED